jgi:GxxExxY protein
MTIFLEKELGSILMKSFFEIRNKYGRWHNERIYDRALQEHYDGIKLKYISQPRIKVYSLDSGKVLGVYIPDLLVKDRVIIELKARDFINKEEHSKAMEYLKCSNYEILYLVNFRDENFKPRRYIYTNDRKKFINLIKNNR